MLAQSIVNEVDIVFLGRLPCPESSNTQAALLPSLVMLWAFGGSLSAISVGTQAFTARRDAEGRHVDAGSVLTNALALALGAGVVFTLLAYLAMDSVIALAAPTAAVREAARSYLEWRLLGITSMAATFALKAFFDGIGKTHVHLVASVVMNVLNVILCVVLIFGSPGLGVPKLGIAGAGIAGFVSTWVGLAVMVAFALRPGCRARYQPFRAPSLSRALSWDLVKLSTPSGVATVVIMTGVMMFVAIALKLDELAPIGAVSALCPGGKAEPVNGAATTVIIGLLKLTFSAGLAFGTSTATLVGQSLGEKDAAKAEAFGWTSAKLGLLIFGVVGLVELAFAPQILAFVTHSPLVQAAALTPLRIMGIATPIIAVGMIMVEALFGAGNTRFVMIAQFSLHFGVLVPFAYVLGVVFGLGLSGIWIAAGCYALALAAVMCWKFRRGEWKTIAL